MQEDSNINENVNNTESVGKKNRTKENKATNNEAQKEDVKNLKSLDSKMELESKQAFMYLGPNIPGGILFKGSVFKSSTKDIKYLEETFQKLPEIKELFIEAINVPEFKKELQIQGSEAYRLYQSVELSIREGVLRNV